jgi:hypothetical protein
LSQEILNCAVYLNRDSVNGCEGSAWIEGRAGQFSDQELPPESDRRPPTPFPRHWVEAIPELGTYPCYTTRSRLSAYVSPGNSPPGAFDELVARLR